MTYQMVQRKEFSPLLICLHQLLQSISKSRNSYLKDTTDFINYTFQKKGENRTFLVSVDRPQALATTPQNEAFK